MISNFFLISYFFYYICFVVVGCDDKLGFDSIARETGGSGLLGCGTLIFQNCLIWFTFILFHLLIIPLLPTGVMSNEKTRKQLSLREGV